MTGYALDVLKTERAIEALRPEWQELHDRGGERKPFLSPTWLLTVHDRAHDRGAPYIATLRRGGRLVALLPLRMTPLLGFRVLRFMGERRSDYLDVLREPDEPEAALVAFRLLFDRSDWDIARLCRLSSTGSDLVDAPLPRDVRDERIVSGRSYFTALDGSWDELVRVGPNWLHRMKRKLRKFYEAGATTERYVGAEAAKHVGDVAYVESRSWKMGAKSAEFVHRGDQERLRRVLLTVDDRPAIELWIARLSGEPIGFELNVVTGSWLGLWQGAYADSQRSLGPGAALEFLSIRRAWQDGVREYDYLGGDEPYKLERTTASREIMTRTFHSDTPRGWLAQRVLVGLPLAARGALLKARTLWG